MIKRSATVVTLVVIVAGTSVALAQEPCTAERIAEVEKAAPDLIVVPQTWDDVMKSIEDMEGLYNCTIGFSATPMVFDKTGAPIGDLIGAWAYGGSTDTSKTYWVGGDKAGMEFAVAAADAEVSFRNGVVAGIKLGQDSDLYEYNVQGSPRGIFGPEPAELGDKLGGTLTKYYVAGAIPSDRALVSFRSTPSGADVWIGDLMFGKTELSGRLRRSAFSKVRLSLEGYADCNANEGSFIQNENGWGEVFTCELRPASN